MIYKTLRRFSFLLFKLKFPSDSDFVSSLKDRFKGLNFIDFGAYQFKWFDDSYLKYIAFEPNKNFILPSELKDKVVLNREVISIDEGILIFYDEGLTSGSSKSSLTNGSKEKSFEVVSRNLYEYEHEYFENSAIKINIEGAEYELLEYLSSIKLLAKCKFILLQTHPLKTDLKTYQSLKRKNHIMKELGFRKVFCFPLIWELWQK